MHNHIYIYIYIYRPLIKCLVTLQTTGHTENGAIVSCENPLVLKQIVHTDNLTSERGLHDSIQHVDSSLGYGPPGMLSDPLFINVKVTTVLSLTRFEN